MNNASEIKFRCSGLHAIMTEPQSKKELLSKTCITHLINVFVQEKHKRREEITSKYLEKGNEREPAALKLTSELLGLELVKNEIRLENDYIQGEPDTFVGTDIRRANHTLDTKVSWSAFTFFRAKADKIPAEYYWQGMGYMMLTGARKHTVAFCLTNATAKLILDEKRKLSYHYEIIDSEPEEYKQKCRQIEINHIFDIHEFADEYKYFEYHNDMEAWNYDIPQKERMFTFTIDRDEAAITKIKERVHACRDYMDKNLFKVEPVEVAKLKIKKMKALEKKLSK